MTTRDDIPIDTLRRCPGCYAPAVDPYPDLWHLDLIKEGSETGPVQVFYTPHTSDCTRPLTRPEPGTAIRIPGTAVNYLRADPPPVPDVRGIMAWPDGSSPARDFTPGVAAAIRQADGTYWPEPVTMTSTVRNVFLRWLDVRSTRDPIRPNNFLYDGPPGADPPTPDRDPSDDGWTPLGHTGGGLAFDEHGQYIPAGDPEPPAGARE